MKKDIQIPEIDRVFMAVVKEYNTAFRCDDWNAYLINDNPFDLEMVLVVSKGFDKDSAKETAVLRHKIKVLPKNAYAKIEMLQEEVLKLTNSFQVTFFINSQLFEKQFVFEKGTLKEGSLRLLPLLNKRGVQI